MAGWWTFALQVVNFLVLVWLLERFLYRPVQRTIAARQRQATELVEQANTARGAAETMRADVEHAREGIAAERERTIAEARAAAAAERDELLGAARATADEIAAAGRSALDDERHRVLAELEAHAGELAAAIAARLLGQLGSPAFDDALFARLVAYLDALPAERSRVLAGQAAAGVEVVTAHEPPAEVAARWREQLAARLGDAARLSFRVDPALVAGVELHFRTAVVRLSWRDALGRAEEALTHAALG